MFNNHLTHLSHTEIIIWLRHMYDTTHYHSCVAVQLTTHTQKYTCKHSLFHPCADNTEDTCTNGRCVLEGTRWHLRETETREAVKYEQLQGQKKTGRFCKKKKRKKEGLGERERKIDTLSTCPLMAFKVFLEQKQSSHHLHTVSFFLYSSICCILYQQPLLLILISVPSCIYFLFQSCSHH